MINKRGILLFVDGLGLGEEEKWQYNPIETGNVPFLKSLLKSKLSIPIDATLGVPGIPQSASGQTAILTGINAPKTIGKHLNGLPNRDLIAILQKENLFIKLQKLGLKVTNANAYNRNFIYRLQNNSSNTEGMSASTVATLAAGLSLNSEQELKEKRALYQDLTNRIMMEKYKSKVPLRSPKEAGVILDKIARCHDFTFFEYFQTDLAGHRKDFNNAYRVLEELDQFIESLLESLDFKNTLFILVSDHGNVEDLSTSNHTMNRVPVIAWGNGSDKFLERIRTIQDITPSIVDYFSK